MIPNLTVRAAHPASLASDLLMALVPEEPTTFRKTVHALEKEFGNCATPLRHSAFRGKFQETLEIHPARGKARRLLLVGMGRSGAITAERLRRIGGTGVRAAHAMKATNLAVAWPPHRQIPVEHEPAAQALAEGMLLSAYRYTAYKTRKDENTAPLRRIVVASTTRSAAGGVRRGLATARTLATSVFLARDLENAPGNEIYPETLARAAARAVRRTKVSVRTLGPTRMRRLKMGGVLGVSAGSARPPRFIIMEYRGARRPPIALVGKGVTFDSGGISIKPSANMSEMKMDMSGAAAVIGTIQAAARLRLAVHLVGLIPAAENLPGGRAIKPGDILKHVNGMTSEVDNTDAEGRLILADALAYASRFKPELIIDLATLTGAVVVALGHAATGMMGNDRKAMDALTRAGEQSYERVWELPLFEEYERLIRSDVADVKNVGGRWAGAITGALFLKRFVGDRPWVHLDIAGTAMMEERFEYIPKGGSGVGVRLLIEFLRSWKRS